MTSAFLVPAFLGVVSTGTLNLYPDRAADAVRFLSADPAHASVSAYTIRANPMAMPDYSGAAPTPPPGTIGAEVQLYLPHPGADMLSGSHGEDLSSLSTISEASHESRQAAGSTATAHVTSSTRQKPSPFAERYLSDFSVKHDAAAAAIVEEIFATMPDRVTMSDYYLRQRVGHDPIDGAPPRAAFRDVVTRERRSRIPRRTVRPHKPLERSDALIPPELQKPKHPPGYDELEARWQAYVDAQAQRDAVVRGYSGNGMTAVASLFGAGLLIGGGYMILNGLGFM